MLFSTKKQRRSEELFQAIEEAIVELRQIAHELLESAILHRESATQLKVIAEELRAANETLVS